MSDRIPAEIWIGGKIAASLVPGLCAAIAGEGVCLEWGDARVHPAGASDLTDAMKENAQGERLLWFCDDEASYGEFDILESFLREHEIPFTRHSAGRYEYDPETVHFRPGHGLITCATNAAAQPVVEVAEITPVDNLLTAAIEQRQQESDVDCWSMVVTARQLLRDRLSADVPPLEPFQIEAAEAPAAAVT
jgi:hypothetical protein